jgi:hypothetical protein
VAGQVAVEVRKPMDWGRAFLREGGCEQERKKQAFYPST